MRKWLALLLAVAFLGFLSFSANAAIKPGSTCKKLGQINIYSGKKYTCINSGKKLIWNKGDKIAITRVNPSPTPFPTKTNAKGATPIPLATYAQTTTITKTAKIDSDLDISYISPINWGGLPADNFAVMKFPVTLKSYVDANIIRVLIQHSEGVQNIVLSGQWDWQYVKAGDSKIMDLTVPLAYLLGERNKGYSGGYTFKVFLNYKDPTKREARYEIPIDYVLPTLG